MKVKIHITFAVPSGIEYHGTSEVIEWDYPVLPIAGDDIDFTDCDGEKCFKMTYPTEEDKQTIEGNSFSFFNKQFSNINGESVVKLYFGDLDRK